MIFRNIAPKILEPIDIPLSASNHGNHLLFSSFFSSPKQRHRVPRAPCRRRGIGQFAAPQHRVDAIDAIEAPQSAQRGGPLQAAAERGQHGTGADGVALQKGHPGVMMWQL